MKEFVKVKCDVCIATRIYWKVGEYSEIMEYSYKNGILELELFWDASVGDNDAYGTIISVSKIFPAVVFETADGEKVQNGKYR